ncbi:hypothetical protein HETIRDRAFT_142431 [Heterobasidion irregulare TC 32-1]|uniref:Uncharacterized protein n=1 Tax=Heterobasidion irregulare (strain TC 32-1) TaxID=747525 RepID=W4KFI9_HETIT|nr:uncharacterized protein HETIRDRAFT_142431 [Heterobasidion irregulare TC 32-1]ETW84494.1 hypothetical protein HETIRDRAFT_142431 [Heterobasidion irregulare TC 32-1]
MIARGIEGMLIQQPTLSVPMNDLMILIEFSIHLPSSVAIFSAAAPLTQTLALHRALPAYHY